MKNSKNKKFMLRAIELAKMAEGKTYPNPLVGAVVVSGGRIEGEGFHEKAGLPHAEIIALKKAGIKSRKADLYVSLEPCAHQGRTPPCVHSIKKSGIKKVYIAMKDPNPAVNGKGIEYLLKNGIEVDMGLCKSHAGKINPYYMERMRSQHVHRNN